MNQKLETVSYGYPPVYGAAHEEKVNARVAELNAEGWRVVQITAFRVGDPGTTLLLEHD